MNNFNKLLNELRSLNLPSSDFAVFGSGPLAIRGIRDVNDVDIIVKPKLWRELKEKYEPKNEKLIIVGSIEIYKNWSPWYDNVNELIDEADNFYGVRFVKLEKVLNWKELLNRDKDKRDIILIKKFMLIQSKKSIPNK